MASRNRKDREEFIAVVCQEAPDVPWNVKVELARRLMRYAAGLNTIAERQCNEEMSDREAARVEKREASLERLATETATRLGFKANFSGDPRGYVFKVILPSGRYNTWGGASEGWGVP